MIQIKVEGNVVNLYKDDRDSPIYSIRKPELPLTRKENGDEISEWIDHLMSKTWIEENTLYELATLINKEFPKNGIDWAATFFPVEKRQYLDHVKLTKRLASDGKKADVNTKSLFDSIKIGIEESNDFVNGKISKIVENNLHKYGLK